MVSGARVRMIRPMSDSADRELDAQIGRVAGEIIRVRRWLHAHPEPSLSEFQTTTEVARHLTDAGVPYRLAPTGRGLIAGPEPGPGGIAIALRADMDALPIADGKEGTPYRSTCEGLMHACGHDAHTAMALGAALALHRSPGVLPPGRTWRAIFQPAEETGQGAFEMIEAGAMQGVGAIVALHVDPERPVGRVGVRRGVLTADCRDLHVVIRGRGGHAARPYQGIDAVAAAATFVTQAYQVVPRSVDVREPMVVTFGSIHGGEAANIIAERVELWGTVRAFGGNARDRVEAALGAVARGVAAATGAEVELSFLRGVGSVINDRRVIGAMAAAAAGVVGPDHVDEIDLPSLGGEDFAAYLERAPGAMMRLGVATELPWPGLHSPRFDIDERALEVGARILARSVARLARGGGDHDAGTTPVHPE